MTSNIDDPREEASVFSDDDDVANEETENANNKDNVLLAQRETRALRLLRALLTLILVASTALASWLVFCFMRKAEQQTFLSEFANFADRVVQALHTNTERRLLGIDTLGVALTSYAKSVNATWPFVTVPDFDILGASARAIANANYVMMFPFITHQTRAAWEKYSVENHGWVYQKSEVWNNGTLSEGSLQGNRNLSIFHRSVVDTAMGSVPISSSRSETPLFLSGISNAIYEFTKDGPGRSKGSGPFLPFWQMSPPDVIPPIAINFNALSLPDNRESLYNVLQSGQAVISALKDYQVNKDDYKNYGQDFARKPAPEPYSTIKYPVFDSFTHNRSLAAVLYVDFSWGSILKGILPVGANGVDAIIENACNQTMTFRINGPEVVYRGVGDLHDKSFDKHEVTLLLNSGLTTGSNGVQVNSVHCPYTVRLYPSKTLYKAYTTSKPIIMTVLVVAIFGFTSLVFFTYDQLVERRQTKVMQTAVRSNRIVSSLFPSNVRDRLFQINKPLQQKTVGPRKGDVLTSMRADGWKTTGDTPKNRLKVFLNGVNGDEPYGIRQTDEFNDVKPIADSLSEHHCTFC